MLTSQWDAAARTVALNSIEFYQRSISPRKGFDCPHRILYGSQSCSSDVKHMLTNRSLLSAIKFSIQRFQACSRASQILKSQKTAAGFRCIVIPCCIPL
ncbi:membrane protein insertion efficiency factor YidD [Chroococcidiopsis sp. FACHB-1243]|uniref:membrane protein insertion efficiency factor YidD n=1 Tax=Chroococcidiopsis sp. [FACHB-1243] TaxID=2692781 RepID=UPI00177C22E1|nr:membrane protein insertion efficiency factor YidD [Chroococcidiopsis sp. [FACHB-1243]]MBD2308216.1 membrane protein insertion efficiency factor YidD [Chroococcidiopsis sp. [FACHB-1243]]